MKTRIVRWVVYLAIGIGLGAAYNHFYKQKEMNAGVIEVSPDSKDEVIEIPSRTETPEDIAADEASGEEFTDGDDITEQIPSTEEIEEFVEEKIEESTEAIADGLDKAKEEIVEPAEEKVEEIIEEIEDEGASLTPMP